MSEKEQSVDSNQNDEKIKVYDNDDAYLFGDASLNESNEVNDDKNNNDIGNIVDENLDKKSNKLIENENEKNFETPKSLENSKKIKNNSNNIEEEYNNNNNDNNNYNNNYICQEEDNYKEDQLLTNKKFMINDITTDMENDQENLENKTEKSLQNENESNESEVPLITLNFLSICQCCKNQFNSQNNIPYLFKCGHFFCKQCIEEQFTDEEGIKCPNDGIVAKYISELKILNNFINDKPIIKNENIKYNEKKYCEYHKGQKLTHYIENTKELICVYCAFEKYKSNPGVEIKDIYEKCKNIEYKIDSIIEDNQQNVEIIQNCLRDIKLNKENEEKRLNDAFNDLYEMLKIKKEELRLKIEKIFTENAKKLSQKLEIFSEKLEKSEKIKNEILFFQKNQEEISFSQIIDIYDNYIKEIDDIANIVLLQKYKFQFSNKLEIKEIINKFGDLELLEKKCNFIGSIPQVNLNEEKTNNKNTNNEQFIRVNKDINLNNNNNNNNSYKIDNFYHFINNKENQKQKKQTNETSIQSNISNNKNYKSNINNNNYKYNLNKSNGHLNNNNLNNNAYNDNNKSINKSKIKLSKKYLNNKNLTFLDMTSSTYGNSLSKIENHSTIGIAVNKPKSNKKFKYNLSLGQNCSFNNIRFLNSVNNNQKLNNIRTNTKKNNSKNKNNKSITTPSRINLKKDNK